MYVIKMKTIISYIALCAVIISSFALMRFARTTSIMVSATQEQVEVPIIMYHSILDKTNNYGKYIVSTDNFEKDLIYLQNNGYTTITMNDLIGYVYNGTSLPEKPVILSFDDGYYNNYKNAYPLLKKYNMKAVISIIGYYTDLYSELDEENPKYSHITWDEIEEMTESGLVEIQNHSYNLHSLDKGRNGAKKNKNETTAQYEKVISEDIMKLQSRIIEETGLTPSTFVYPFGAVSEASYDIIKHLGFKASFSCQEGTNKITQNPQCLYMLNRNLRTNKTPIEKLL